MSMGGGGGSQQQGSVGYLPPGFAKRLKQTSRQAQNVLGESFVGNKPLVAGTNANIDQGQQMALNAANAQQGTLQGQQNIYNNLQQFGNAQQDSVLQRRLQDIATMSSQNLKQNILPAIQGNAVQAGQVGSSRQGIAQGLAAQGAIDSATRGQTELLANAEAQRLAALQAAGNFGGNYLQQQLMPATTIGGVGAQQRDIQQQQLQDPLLRQQAELQRLQGLSNIQTQASSPFTGNMQTSTGGGGGGNPLQTALGIGSGIVGLMQ